MTRKILKTNKRILRVEKELKTSATHQWSMYHIQALYTIRKLWLGKENGCKCIWEKCRWDQKMYLGSLLKIVKLVTCSKQKLHQGYNLKQTESNKLDRRYRHRRGDKKKIHKANRNLLIFQGQENFINCNAQIL